MLDYQFRVENDVLKVSPWMYSANLELLSFEELREVVLGKWRCLAEFHGQQTAEEAKKCLRPMYSASTTLCAFCIMYVCHDCPIGASGTWHGCAHTPYIDYCNADTPEECRAAAEAKVEFIEALEDPNA